MTQPETSPSIPDTERVAEGAPPVDAPEAEEPQPEPWTPERVAEWNAYYDLYVMLGVLLLVFVASTNLIQHASLWNQLQVGRMIAATGKPVLTDPFSYTEAGAPWVNIPWLFDLSHAALHKAAYDLAPADPTDQIGSAAKADQIAAGVLVGLNALPAS